MTSRLVLALVLALLAGPARAYQSECYVGGSSTAKCAEGPQAARERWIGPGDEHRVIWNQALAMAGLPLQLLQDVGLRVFTGDEVVDVAGTGQPSFRPVNFIDTTRIQDRAMSVGELAQLPDFSFALWDWAVGNESCPLNADLDEEADAAGCHSFRTHMGAVNSNHFLPQAEHFFAYYHGLALERAAECAVMGARIANRGEDPQGAAFLPFLQACEAEALMLEAVAHHYLQDAWSTGHMWERWGSPDLIDFLNRADAILVALTSGLIHGARAVVQEHFDSIGADVNDALCAPHPEVAWRSELQATPTGGIGDLFLDRLLVAGDFPEQFRLLFSCAVAAMREVYATAGQWHGAPGEPAVGLVSVDPQSAACFGQRATNRAMRHGAGLDFVRAPLGQVHVPLQPGLASTLLPVVSSFLGQSVNPVALAARLALYRADLTRISATLTVFGALNAEGTETATGTLGPLLGILPNGQQIHDPLARYLDPPLPWPVPSDLGETGSADLPTPAGRALLLARAFHRGHAVDWCNVFRAGSPEGLDVRALHERVEAMRDQGVTGPARDAACAVCAEFAVRHLRIGTGPGDYDTSREPLCFYVADDPGAVQYVFREGDDEDGAGGLAASFCHCDDSDDDCGFPPDVLPPGSYLLSCESCTMTGTVLGCSCRRIDSTFQSTQLDVGRCRSEPANTDGVLECSFCP